MARERRLEAHDVEAIFRAFAEIMRELPPDTEAGWLNAEGDLRLAPDIGRKLRTARNVREVLRQIRESQEDQEPTYRYELDACHPYRRPAAGRDPLQPWIPAFAGMTE